MANQEDPPISPPEALEGLRVLDMGMNIAGPFCATLLAEFGAEVVKVERPGAGDPLRALGGEQMAKDGVGLFWAQEARNKKCITANLRHPRVKELVLQLAGQCDVVVESFQPGAAERLGFGYDDLRAVRPDVIMVRVSGYGQTGPYSPKPGYARVAQAFGGLTWLAGTPEMPALTPGSTTMTDYITGCSPPLASSWPWSTAAAPARDRSSTPRSTSPSSASWTPWPSNIVSRDWSGGPSVGAPQWPPRTASIPAETAGGYPSPATWTISGPPWPGPWESPPGGRPPVLHRNGPH